VITNAGFLLKAQIFLGNQNQGIKLGAYSTGALHYGSFALEGGVALYSGYLFKRHTAKARGLNYGYDAFILAGYGKNKNLLVSTFMTDGPYLGTLENDQFFYGFGFGVEKEYLPGELNVFDQRLGKFLMRFSQENNTVNVELKNDVRSGNLFLGEGTDFGVTGMLEITYCTIRSNSEMYHFGIGVSLFTARADYSLTPNNPLNSDDGGKNVWHTKSPYPRLFYANLYALGGYQNETFQGIIKTGMNSQKMGAYIQNTLHDSFGLNPRFPWNVSAKDRWMFELTGGVYESRVGDE